MEMSSPQSQVRCHSKRNGKYITVVISSLLHAGVAIIELCIASVVKKKNNGSGCTELRHYAHASLSQLTTVFMQLTLCRSDFGHQWIKIFELVAFPPSGIDWRWGSSTNNSPAPDEINKDRNYVYRDVALCSLVFGNFALRYGGICEFRLCHPLYCRIFHYVPPRSRTWHIEGVGTVVLASRTDWWKNLTVYFWFLPIHGGYKLEINWKWTRIYNPKPNLKLTDWQLDRFGICWNSLGDREPLWSYHYASFQPLNWRTSQAEERSYRWVSAYPRQVSERGWSLVHKIRTLKTGTMM